MEISFNVTENDYVQYNLYHYAHSPATKRTLMFTRLCVPIVLIICALIIIKHHTLTVWLPVIIIAVVWFYWRPVLFRRSIAKNVKKLMYEGRCSEFIGDFTITLAENVMRYKGHGQVLETAYNRINQVEQDNERIYLYLGSLTAIIIPKIAFGEVSEEDAFLDFLAQKRTAAKVGL